MDNFSKITGTTIMLDAALIYIISQHKLVVFDKTFIICVLLNHILFYFAMYYSIEPLINTLYQILFFFISVSIFVKNRWLLLLNLFLISIIQVFWIIEDRCILNKEDYCFGYAKQLRIATLLFTILLSMKFGYTFFKWENVYTSEDLIWNKL